MDSDRPNQGTEQLGNVFLAQSNGQETNLALRLTEGKETNAREKDDDQWLLCSPSSGSP